MTLTTPEVLWHKDYKTCGFIKFTLVGIYKEKKFYLSHPSIMSVLYFFFCGSAISLPKVASYIHYLDRGMEVRINRIIMSDKKN